MLGHHGRILRVDLTSGQVRVERFGDAFARKFLGGNGFAAALVNESARADTDPFGPDNAIAFTVGPLADTPVWGASRGHMASLSPLTGHFADSNFGGRFAIAQKRTGFDAICVTGAAAGPVVLKVTEQGGEIVGAADLWGRTTEETLRALQESAGRGAVSAAIGPAGEARVLFANVICGGGRSGAAGRGGLGAVMGAKRLKAVVAAGDVRTQVARPDALKDFLARKLEAMKQGTAMLSDMGTPALVNVINAKGLLGSRNASRETFAFADDLSGERLKERYVVRNSACYGCPVACGKQVRVPSGEYAGQTLKMPEYETLYAMGAMLDNRDLVSVMNANGLCDRLGLDTISMGVTLAFVAECVEKGIVTEADLGGAVRFADGEGLVELVRATAARQGVGELLALGSERLAARFGGDSRKYLYSVKGLEVAGHSARGLRSMSLGYAVSTRGGSHHDTRADYDDPGFEGQAAYSVRSQNFTAVGDSLVLCRFVEEGGFGKTNNQDVAHVLNLVTGWDVDVEELERIGERIYNLERCINVRRGVRRKHDTLPYRTLHEPIPDGPRKGRRCPPETLDAMLDAYYALRGWTPDGEPRQAKLDELGLSQCEAKP